MKVKEESEKVGLKLNIQKIQIMASGPITSWEIDGETVETIADLIFCKGDGGGHYFFILFRLTYSSALWGGREGCCKQITLACACSASATLGLPLLTARVASLPTLLGL